MLRGWRCACRGHHGHSPTLTQSHSTCLTTPHMMTDDDPCRRWVYDFRAYKDLRHPLGQCTLAGGSAGELDGKKFEVCLQGQLRKLVHLCRASRVTRRPLPTETNVRGHVHTAPINSVQSPAVVSLKSQQRLSGHRQAYTPHAHRHSCGCQHWVGVENMQESVSPTNVERL